MSLLAETIAKRRADWDRLEELLGLVASGGLHKRPPTQVVELSELYRRACADLAMAEQYQLSPSMVDYLHALVGRAHNTLYASQRFQYRRWFDLAFKAVPREIYRDPCIQVTSLLFFGLFALSAYLSYDQDTFGLFGEKVLGPDATQKLQQDFGQEMRRSPGTNMIMAAFYIKNNTGIGFQCFALGPLILPGLFATVFNAVLLGSSFGFMARPDVDGGDQFMEFVTAHGAFELTAIALAAGIGLRIGIRGWLFTEGLTRTASFHREGKRAISIISVAGVLFFLAALTEGFISPSNLPYGLKALWLIGSSTLLMFYFVVLGYPEPDRAIGQD